MGVRGVQDGCVERPRNTWRTHACSSRGHLICSREAPRINTLHALYSTPSLRVLFPSCHHECIPMSSPRSFGHLNKRGLRMYCVISWLRVLINQHTLGQAAPSPKHRGVPWLPRYSGAALAINSPCLLRTGMLQRRVGSFVLSSAWEHVWQQSVIT